MVLGSSSESTRFEPQSDSPRSLARSRWALLFIGLLAVSSATGCSSGGATPTPGTATCSATVPCPQGLVCVVERGLCALPGPNPMDLAMVEPDLAMEPRDMTAVDLYGADLAGAPDLSTPGDMKMNPDMTQPPTDMAMPPSDMATTPDMATPPPDMGTPPPLGPRACPSANFCWENPLPQPRTLSGIWGTGANDIWAVGHYGVVLHWNGTSWLQIPTGITSELQAVWGRSANEVWVVGDYGKILFWNGTRFVAQTSGTSERLQAVWGSSAAVWAAGTSGTMLKWDGASWSAVPTGISENLHGLWGSAANDVWAVGTYGYACHYGGTSWTCGREFGSYAALAVTGTSKNNAWAVTNSNQIFRWNGTSWTATVPSGAPSALAAVFAIDATNVWAAGTTGAGLSYNGTMWSPTRVANDTVYGLWGSAANNLYAVGAAGEINRFDGTSWKQQSEGWTAQVTAMWGTSERDIWVFTSDRYARHFDGSKWTSMLLPGIGYAAGGTSPTDMWVGSDSGRVFRYDGSKFTLETTRDTSTIYSIYIAASDRVVLAGSSSVQLWDGARYTISLAKTGMSVWGTGPNDIWVGGDSGCQVYYFNGASWTGGMAIPACSTGPVVSIHGTGPNDVYFAAEYSASLYRWDGTKWNTLTVGSTAGKVSVFATPTRVFVGTAGGEVLTGLGTTWNQAVDVDARLDKILGFGADKLWIAGRSGFVLSYRP